MIIHFVIESLLLLVIAGGVVSIATDIAYIVRAIKDEANE